MTARFRFHSLGLAAVLLVAGTSFAGPPAQTAPAVEPPRCAHGQRVQVKPSDWTAKVRAAPSAGELKSLFTALGLKTDWARAACGGTPAVVPELQDARVLSADTRDVLLQVRGTVCGGTRLLDGVLLHPMGAPDTWCALRLPFLPGVPEASWVRTTVGFEHLTDATRQVIRVDSKTSDGRDDVEALEYWEGGREDVHLIFIVPTKTRHQGVVERASTAKVSPRGEGFPRELFIEETMRDCGQFVDLPSGARALSGTCREESQKTPWCYRRSPARDTGGYHPCALSP
ncbi:hypothetical protein [Archangium primigenium]|uniref:hypothetical protein n=1 Tax=[Archangium] primigenium TaxID=2792470 RepID=UPI001956F9A8|nr:hypothetical protein [Archangium primigenium]MBM7119251.1 hypothetical protein [Archangium primigenium]